MKLVDRSKTRYGSLVTTEHHRQNPTSKQRKIQWLCDCDCGNQKWIGARNLVAGNAISCGCHKKTLAKNLAEKNRINKDSKYFFASWFKKIKTNAKRRGIEFDLTIEQLDSIYEKQNGLCYYTGQLLNVDFTSGKFGTQTNLSIDRIKSEDSYQIDNIVLCTKNSNMAKQGMSQFEFIELCHAISRHHTTKIS